MRKILFTLGCVAMLAMTPAQIVAHGSVQATARCSEQPEEPPLAQQLMGKAFVAMPDSLVPYLDRNLRQELVELCDMGVKSEVKNLLDGSTTVDTLTSRGMELRLNEVATMQIGLLPTSEKGDSLLCVVRTVWGPEPESTVELYDLRWHLRERIDIDTCLLAQRPDSMSEQRFVELSSMIEPRMVQATLDSQSGEIVLQQSLPLVSDDEKRQLKTILVQRKLKWNGMAFKNC